MNKLLYHLWYISVIITSFLAIWIGKFNLLKDGMVLIGLLNIMWFFNTDIELK